MPRLCRGTERVGRSWGGGRPIREYDPTPEQVVAWALAPEDSAGHVVSES
jgi:hypothetical protein